MQESIRSNPLDVVITVASTIVVIVLWVRLQNTDIAGISPALALFLVGLVVLAVLLYAIRTYRRLVTVAPEHTRARVLKLGVTLLAIAINFVLLLVIAFFSLLVRVGPIVS